MSRINDIREREKAATPPPWIEKDGCIHIKCPEMSEEYCNECSDRHKKGQDPLPCDEEGLICIIGGWDVDFVAHSRADIPYLLARLDEAVGMLKKLEWSGTDGACPMCGPWSVSDGHAPDCARNALIKEVEG